MDTKYLEIIKAPLVTEKSRMEQENGKYTFLVSPKATKTEIKDAIEKIFKVKIDRTKISWDQNLLETVCTNKSVTYSETNLRIGMYRPFFKQNVYFSQELSWSRYLQPLFSPTSCIWRSGLLFPFAALRQGCSGERNSRQTKSAAGDEPGSDNQRDMRRLQNFRISLLNRRNYRIRSSFMGFERKI